MTYLIEKAIVETLEFIRRHWVAITIALLLFLLSEAVAAVFGGIKWVEQIWEKPVQTGAISLAASTVLTPSGLGWFPLLLWGFVVIRKLWMTFSTDSGFSMQPGWNNKTS